MFHKFFEYHSFRIVKKHYPEHNDPQCRYRYFIQGYCRRWYWPVLHWSSIDWWFDPHTAEKTLQRQIDLRDVRLTKAKPDEIVKVVV